MIEVKIKINNKFEVKGIYDTGSNVSLLNARVLKMKINIFDYKKVKIRTINGVNNTDHLVKLKIKIFNIEKDVNVLVINNENFKFDFLIGLDLIKDFKLTQDEDLCIAQKCEKYTVDKDNNVETDNKNKAVILDKKNEKNS